MGTIEDRDEENDDDDNGDSRQSSNTPGKVSPAKPLIEHHPHNSNEVSSYLINLQPISDSPFHKFLYEQRAICADRHGSDPTYLYPFHASVSGFFDAAKTDIGSLVEIMVEDLMKELAVSARVNVGKVV